MLEKDIEARLVKEVEKRGGLCYKFVSPSNPGVPDRIVITPEGRIIFVELKAAWGSLSNLQKWQAKRMGERGVDVRRIKGLDEVKAFVKEVFP